MEILDATIADASAIIKLQKLSYLSEAAIYNDFSIQPLTQSVEQLIADFNHKTILKAVRDERIIGSVNGSMKENNCLIGRLMVHPDFQGWGIGSRLMEAMEARFPTAQSWELFTGEMSLRNIHMYEQLGYRIVRKEPFEGTHFNIVIMRKVRQ
ncbi:MAG: GNAT family N-acetyltransferase [Desulfuromonadales bacterium]|nr:GNAT family N-acetyltransferase [Desulfuromonadales bacterium]